MIMKQETLDKFVCSEAKNFLVNLGIPSVVPSLIDKYLDPGTLQAKPKTISEIYARILKSAQNANMKAGVIGRAIDGIEHLGSVLCDFNPADVIKQYNNDAVLLLDQIQDKVKPRGAIRKTSRSIWPQYCRCILSAADFLVQFRDADDFFRWIDFFDQDNRARASLPMLLSREITGLGFALSCDLLKEMGYVSFPKPDVHLRDIFRALALCPNAEDDYCLFKSIVRDAGNEGVTPYSADKAFWLIGSGYFYNDLHIGNNGRIGSHKNQFIDHITNHHLLNK